MGIKSSPQLTMASISAIPETTMVLFTPFLRNVGQVFWPDVDALEVQGSSIST